MLRSYLKRKRKELKCFGSKLTYYNIFKDRYPQFTVGHPRSFLLHGLHSGIEHGKIWKMEPGSLVATDVELKPLRLLESCDRVHLLIQLEGNRVFHHPHWQKSSQPTPYHTIRKKRQCQVEEYCLIFKVVLFLWERSAFQKDVQYFLKTKINNICYFKKFSWSFCLVGEICYTEFSYFLFTVTDWSDHRN